MRTQDVLLASLIVAGVTGAGTALAVRFVLDDAARAKPEAARLSGALGDESAAHEPAAALEALSREFDALRMENGTLEQRLRELEDRLATMSSRTALEETPRAGGSQLAPEDVAAVAAALGSGSDEITPAFVASVDRALAEIRAKEEAERDERRKELQAQRIEERMLELQKTLGLTKSQVHDMRTALIAQDDQRELLFEAMRDGDGDRRTMFDEMRKLRDQTHTTLQTFLTPEQFSAYSESEESDFRRGFGGFGREGGGPAEPGGRGR